MCTVDLLYVNSRPCSYVARLHYNKANIEGTDMNRGYLMKHVYYSKFDKGQTLALHCRNVLI